MSMLGGLGLSTLPSYAALQQQGLNSGGDALSRSLQFGASLYHDTAERKKDRKAQEEARKKAQKEQRKAQLTSLGIAAGAGIVGGAALGALAAPAAGAASGTAAGTGVGATSASVSGTAGGLTGGGIAGAGGAGGALAPTAAVQALNAPLALSGTVGGATLGAAGTGAGVGAGVGAGAGAGLGAGGGALVGGGLGTAVGGLNAARTGAVGGGFIPAQSSINSASTIAGTALDQPAGLGGSYIRSAVNSPNAVGSLTQTQAPITPGGFSGNAGLPVPDASTAGINAARTSGIGSQFPSNTYGGSNIGNLPTPKVGDVGSQQYLFGKTLPGSIGTGALLGLANAFAPGVLGAAGNAAQQTPLNNARIGLLTAQTGLEGARIGTEGARLADIQSQTSRRNTLTPAELNKLNAQAGAQTSLGGKYDAEGGLATAKTFTEDSLRDPRVSTEIARAATEAAHAGYYDSGAGLNRAKTGYETMSLRPRLDEIQSRTGRNQSDASRLDAVADFYNERAINEGLKPAPLQPGAITPRDEARNKLDASRQISDLIQTIGNPKTRKELMQENPNLLGQLEALTTDLGQSYNVKTNVSADEAFGIIKNSLDNGDIRNAEQQLKQYSTSIGDPVKIQQLQDRIDKWKKLHGSALRQIGVDTSAYGID